ncbi:hypothetical protein KSX_48730 [Ktedonospora formicarum]|uniref:Methyltransferase domain-containing protein n=1 Tax=Ktedonospora formicarum TaxID=2778364 RepID=A0A8J3I4X1_9CHLR|nr:hypothetical protein KSX_48730 [Ktedonospora formicarum]
MLDFGWRYDLMLWYFNTFTAPGKWRALQREIIELADLQSGEAVLDVGCGTGTLAIDAYRLVGAKGRVCGIDPGSKQIERAYRKARTDAPSINFQVGAIENLPFPDKSFDLVLSTLMMHVLPDDLKRQGLVEIERVLKPGGRVLIVDTRRSEEGSTRPAHTGPWNSGVQDQPGLLSEAGFIQIESGKLGTDSPKLPEIGYVKARKSL